MVLLVAIWALAPAVGLAQVKPAVPAAKANQTSPMQQMLDLSHPGPNHALLGTLAGTWHFQDMKLAFVQGTLSRKPIYNGRFYMVEIIGGRLQVPVGGGRMQDESYQGLQLEGYDNAQLKFVTTAINNHIGSNTELQTGTYDVAAKALTYEWDSELIQGQPKHNRRVLKMIDSNRYTEVYYDVQNGKATPVRTLEYTRSN
ncbi:DUF1579 domain-containing protein [Hymenobacter tibetensis]|uniref:DUF1579 domain-containing protein n=1 Tax=Hymenobacter tibetensis TaxID=497967 RepID=A0ABY4D4I6_9BACT|nr:DUF1579 family protein [Hymenobacter tibetensis]UOG77191.1 DUF1579 domain-containing protein [Hymenobacter tibetensis]